MEAGHDGALPTRKGFETMKTFQDQIDATHPMDTEDSEAFQADSMAMNLVGERHEKRELVDLVRWLILKRPELISRDPGDSEP